MHFVTGGAFNGKLAWVYSYYQLTSEKLYTCFSGYERQELKTDDLSDQQVVIINGIEQYVKLLLEKGLSYKHFLEQLTDFIRWEQKEEHRKLVLIGTDISKGVVPIEHFVRTWRDEVGWCYQKIMKQADLAHMIWYQIPQTLKNKEESR